MLIAIDKDGKRVHIDDANKTEKYYCPSCKSELILKRGEERIHHFAHRKCDECKDSWHYDMTDWHYQWQNRFPPECQEVVKNHNGETHRADVLIDHIEKVDFTLKPEENFREKQKNIISLIKKKYIEKIS